MNKFKEIHLETWKRTERFNFFQSFHAPHFNVSIKIDAENVYKYAKANDESFFLLSLYAIVRAANRVPELRQRYINGTVIEFEKIAIMSPIMNYEDYYHQIWCEYEDDFTIFKANTIEKIAKAKADNPEPLPDNFGEDFICASCSPWMHFDCINQAAFSPNQAVPILAWGKMNKEYLVPFSCQFHHSFVDALHVSRFFAEIEKCFAHPELLFTSVVYKKAT